MENNRNKNGGPKAPKVERLSELIDRVTSMKVSIHDPGGEETNNFLQEIVDALDWTATMLENRKGYQQKQQSKRKVLEAWAKQNLSPDELAEIDRQATVRANEKEVQRG